MSKTDAMRAMREARYEASRAPAARPDTAAPAARPGRAPRTPAQPPTRAEETDAVPGPAQAGLCGHRAISGRTCTREKDHPAKSHRYS